jgi:hypothetical protein
MRRLIPTDPYVEAKLFGILLSGVFGRTRVECSPESRLRLELRPSGTRAMAPPKPDAKPER